ncbi:dynein light chain type 1 [Penicillium hispanicum]|uniref:dynein light chain type 1 n=1 Tax=Penicillium hispanicum TaxID=1080232 RepID=UPI0025414F78|nr:dynein light chain type 1 [Penicillium hispanicum]KAJ5586795.1 dynein light chain type 1 [Penicillium hispanicum]
MTTEKKEKMEAQVKSVDMTEDMQQEAIDLAIEAMDKYHIEKYPTRSALFLEHIANDLQDIAQYIKKEVRQHLPSIPPSPRTVADNSSSSILGRAPLGTVSLDGTLEALSLTTKHFIYFYLGHCAILLFKTQ